MTVLSERLGGIIPPLCTPMTASYEVDVPSLQRLLEFQIAAGVHGVFALGSTSEAVFLTDEQRATALAVTVETVAGRVPVVAGCIDMTTARVAGHAHAAARAGVDALVVTAPFYTRISQAEILEHFRIIHQSVELPLLAYDIPAATHIKMAAGTVIQMAHEGLIAGVKDSSGDEANFRELILALRALPEVAVFTGSELLVDAALLMGAHGAVPGLANVDPAGYVRLYNAARAADWQTARREQERLFRLFSIAAVGLAGATPRMGVGSSAMGAFKTALRERGVISTNVTGRPQIALDDAEVARVRQTLAAVGLGRVAPHVAATEAPRVVVAE